MIAAIYARKSNDQSVSEDAKSVTRQRERAQAYIAAKGWALGPVFTDDGVSGALFGDSRPGFAQLLATLHPKPAFDILVTMDEARLGRHRAQTEMALATITEAGVRVCFYYVCTTHRERGNTCCPNRLAAPLKALDTLVLTHIETEILNPEMVERMAARAVEGYLDEASSGDPRPALELEATRLEAEIAQYAEAIDLMGVRLPEVVAQLTARHRKLADVRLACTGSRMGPGLGQPRSWFRRSAADWRTCRGWPTASPPMSGRSSGSSSWGAIS
jgi:hypothetical protein